MSKPHAVIIKGNPIYIEGNPTTQKLATELYAEVKQILEKAGYRVTFDAGEPETRPDVKAQLWVGHSRGIDRLQYAPKSVATIELETLRDGNGTPTNRSLIGNDPRHYQLSPSDRVKLEGSSVSNETALPSFLKW